MKKKKKKSRNRLRQILLLQAQPADPSAGGLTSPADKSLLKLSRLSMSGPTWSKPDVSGVADGDGDAATELAELEGAGVADAKPDGVGLASVFGPACAHPNRSRPTTSKAAKDHEIRDVMSITS